MELNKQELELATNIINIGLAKASESMAFFTQDKVSLKSLELNIRDINEIEKFTEKSSNEKIAVLTTELIGDLPGICFLLFSEADCDKIYKVGLPAEIVNNPEKLKVMGDAILLEMDNIIAASVITQFSNIFKCKVHGGVPSIDRIQVDQLTNKIKSSSKCPPFILYFKSHFTANQINIDPEFIWLLNENFITGVKNMATDNEIVESLNKLANK